MIPPSVPQGSTAEKGCVDRDGPVKTHHIISDPSSISRRRVTARCSHLGSVWTRTFSSRGRNCRRENSHEAGQWAGASAHSIHHSSQAQHSTAHPETARGPSPVPCRRYVTVRVARGNRAGGGFGSGAGPTPHLPSPFSSRRVAPSSSSSCAGVSSSIPLLPLAEQPAARREMRPRCPSSSPPPPSSSQSQP